MGFFATATKCFRAGVNLFAYGCGDKFER